MSASAKSFFPCSVNARGNLRSRSRQTQAAALKVQPRQKSRPLLQLKILQGLHVQMRPACDVPLLDRHLKKSGGGPR